MASRATRTTRRRSPSTKSAAAGRRPAAKRAARGKSARPVSRRPARAKAAGGGTGMDAPRPPTRSERLAAAGHPVAKRPFRGNSRTDPGPGKGMRMAVLAVVALAVVVASLAATGVIAQGGNTGTIKVHDGETADPPTRNEPHVAGAAYVEGFNMAAEEGTLDIYSWPPTGTKELMLSTTWQADNGEPANHFRSGPFVLPCGHYRAEAQNGMEEDDFPGGMKSKMFWVECTDITPPPTTSTSSTTSTTSTSETTSGSETSSGSETTSASETTSDSGTTTTNPPPPPPPERMCPTDLTAVPFGAGILLEFNPAPGSDGTNVYRAEGDGDFEWIGVVGWGSEPPHQWYDTEGVEPGVAYAYTVTALYGQEETTDCPIAEATTIPELPTIAAVGLATVAGVAAFAWPRLRKGQGKGKA